MTTLTRNPLEVLVDPAHDASARIEVTARGARFDETYRNADSDAARVPWNTGGPSAALVSWLNAEAPSLVRPGVRVTVVGCGLAHDVAELAGRGYDVVGFDVAPSAIEWARRLYPELADRLVIADLFNLPAPLQRHADVVVEVNTIQSLHPSGREVAAAAIASLARPRGVVLAICQGRDEHELIEHVSGPPFPLTAPELCGLMEAQGLYPTRAVDDYLDDDSPPVRHLRGAFRRR